MKTFLKLFSTLTVLCILTYSAFAKVWTVSSDAARPAQFTTIAAAVSAASPGDTLRVAGAVSYYNMPDLFFPLVFIGEGANNPNGSNSGIITVSLKRLNSSLGSSGSKFYGFNISNLNFSPEFSGSSENQRVLENFIFERCNISSSTAFINNQDGSKNTIKNILYRNCVFSSNLTISGASGFLMGITATNCIFDAGANVNSGVILNGSLIIRNCLFLNSANQRFNVNGAIIENCIFYKAEPTGATNSVFNNNLTYLCNAPTLPYGSNAGSGNLIGVNPMFNSYPPLGANFAWTHNYGLQSGSPAIGTGSNGSNIGLTGGNAPVNNIPGNSRIPVVTALTLPTSSVPVGGTLEVNIQAISRN
ncbi:MAG: hypothetical protein IPN29_14400 [Saprospiraceae bacterium]|nr:hypothetical protein [Saprospiraceae bacterium]